MCRSGSRTANWELYPKALSEMARVCRPHSGRAVLLTHDNKALSKVHTLMHVHATHTHTYMHTCTHTHTHTHRVFKEMCSGRGSRHCGSMLVV